jgi:hypothetical protein
MYVNMHMCIYICMYMNKFTYIYIDLFVYIHATIGNSSKDNTSNRNMNITNRSNTLLSRSKVLITVGHSISKGGISFLDNCCIKYNLVLTIQKWARKFLSILRYVI